MAAFNPDLVGQRVIDLPRKRVKIIRSGFPSQCGADVAIIAAWSPDGQLTRSTQKLVEQLIPFGYICYLTVATNFRGGIRVPKYEFVPNELTLIQRDNQGYDFGSWALTLDMFPEISKADRVLFINDSMIGPFASIEPLLTSFESSPTALWGLSESPEIIPHIQSFCFGYAGGILNEPEVERFWRDIRIQSSKQELINQYEIGHTQLFGTNSYSIQAMFPAGSLNSAGRNPSQFGWKKLLDAGVPLVKRELLLHPEITEDSATIPTELERRYGITVTDWM